MGILPFRKSVPLTTREILINHRKRLLNNETPFAIQEAYICGQMQITFVDNIYGTFNENNASDYLSDNLHLNAEGRRKVAEHLVEAINYYNSFYE